MVSLGLVSAVEIGVIAALAVPLLVWALVVAGLRQTARRNAHSQRQGDMQPGKADV